MPEQYSTVPSLRRFAQLVVLTHLTGLAAAWFWMRPGSALTPLEARMSFLASAPSTWRLGWALWMLCALAFVRFVAAARPPHAADSMLGRVVLPLVLLGAGLDLVCDVAQGFYLPSLAVAGAIPRFLRAERALLVGGTVVANLMYSVATLFLTLALRTLRPLPWPVLAAGVGAFLGGVLMAFAGLRASAALVAWATGPTILLLCLWALGVARG